MSNLFVSKTKPKAKLYNYKIPLLFPEAVVEDKYIEVFKDIAIDENIKDHDNYYSWELAHEAMHFVNVFINKYINTHFDVGIVRTPFFTYVHKLKRLKAKALANKYTTIDEKIKYVDWYNLKLDMIRRKIRGRAMLYKLFKYVDCPDPDTYKPHVKKIREKKEKQPVFNFVHKAVFIRGGPYKGDTGIVLNQFTNNTCIIKIYKGEKIRTRISYLILLTNEITNDLIIR